jgi:hypothetical protein
MKWLTREHRRCFRRTAIYVAAIDDCRRKVGANAIRES